MPTDKPALTQEEYALLHVRQHTLVERAKRGGDYWFTQEDVDFLRQQARNAEASDNNGMAAYGFADLADRIAALLPPPDAPFPTSIYMLDGFREADISELSDPDAAAP